MGIEPTSKAWEAFILPLNYTRALATFTFLTKLYFTLIVLGTQFSIP